MDLTEFASVAHWRRPDQLRGLVKNHPSIMTQSYPLANPGTLFSTANISLHYPSEEAAAVVLTPLFGAGSVGLIRLGPEEPTLEATRRWLELPQDVPACCADWTGELLFIGSTRGRVFVADLKPDDCYLPDGPLAPSGLLTTQADHLRLKDLIVAPSCYATSTVVRGLQANPADQALLLGVEGRSTFVWDLNASGLPVTTVNSTKDEIMVCSRWAPGSQNVFASGSSAGSLQLIDRRSPATNVLRFPVPNDMVRSVDFSTVMPWCLAASSAQGSLMAFDCRIASSAVMSLETLQGDASQVRWSKLNAEVLSTAGSDGSIKLWSLRCPPTYNVGTLQLGLPLADLCTTRTYARSASIGITSDGEVCVTRLADEGLLAIAPRVMSAASQQPASSEQERQAEGALFSRDLGSLAKLVYSCAKAASDGKDFARSAEFMSLLEPYKCPNFSYDVNLTARVEQKIASLFTHRQAVDTFQRELEACSNRLPTTIDLTTVRGLQREDPADLRRIGALRTNVALKQALSSGDVAAVSAVRADSLRVEYLDGELCCNAVSFLLEKNRPAAVDFAQALLNMLIDASGGSNHKGLVKRLILVLSSPLVVDLAALSRKGKKFIDASFRNLKLAQETISLQLEIGALSAEGKHAEIVRKVAEYQERCLKNDELGVCGWVAQESICQYLSALAATSNFVGFFWTAAQLADSLSTLRGAKAIEEMNFAQMERIRVGSEQLKSELLALRSQLKSTPAAAVKSSEGSLRRSHSFLLVLLKVQMECENVAAASGLEHPPALMTRILDVLGTITADLLEAWTAALTGLQECMSQKVLVRQHTLEAVKSFAAKVEELMSVSPEGADDQTIAAVLDVTDAFVEIVSTFPK